MTMDLFRHTNNKKTYREDDNSLKQYTGFDSRKPRLMVKKPLKKIKTNRNNTNKFYEVSSLNFRKRILFC